MVLRIDDKKITWQEAVKCSREELRGLLNDLNGKLATNSDYPDGRWIHNQGIIETTLRAVEAKENQIGFNPQTKLERLIWEAIKK